MCFRCHVSAETVAACGLIGSIDLPTPVSHPIVRGTPPGVDGPAADMMAEIGLAEVFEAAEMSSGVGAGRVGGQDSVKDLETKVGHDRARFAWLKSGYLSGKDGT